MANEVYGRRYSLIIGRPERIEYTNPQPPSSIAKPKVNGEYADSTFSREINSNNVPESFSEDRTVIPQEYREWTTTQFTSTVESTKEGSSDNDTNTKIKLWNLSKEEQVFIKKGYNVILRAGYNQDIAANEPAPGSENPDFQANSSSSVSKDLPLIFTGEVTRVSTSKEGEDTITTVICSDGGFAFKGIRMSKTYPGTYTYRDIIEDWIGEGYKYGVCKGQIFLDTASGLIEQNVTDTTVHGYFIDELNALCNNIGHRAYFCLGKVYVEPKYKGSVKPIISLRNEEDLYYIRWQDSFDGYSEGSDQDTSGVELSVPLDGRLSVVTSLKIEEGEYSGEREVTSVSHILDYEGRDWDTRLVAKAR